MFDKVLMELTGKEPNRIGLPGTAGQFFIPGLQLHTHLFRRQYVDVNKVVSGKEPLK